MDNTFINRARVTARVVSVLVKFRYTHGHAASTRQRNRILLKAIGLVDPVAAERIVRA